ncbi:hypothetical protein QFC22_006048 [Naganishia vaughanmartiniae]|uniref:Uncharacterized protein n=1 Tax=Naganishia vaughanmartiniae TaxID=1424756 RepID=A0ACC2WPS0_9TREE|nr:hypothetical protein QFC22_006048 [Naganishia vaughanmartiniae]
MATAYAPPPAPIPSVGGAHAHQQQQGGGGEKIKPMSNNKKDKEAPPSPPIKIRDAGNGVQYTRMGFLGEGGFARVYELLGPDGRSWAAKVVHKDQLATTKKRTKLYAEIMIHKLMAHPHVVPFREAFEDEDQNMMDLLKRRKRFTEPEARYYLTQIISAVQYMHRCRVMHRDLKLGNVFLDKRMNVQVGDFGLAALIEKEGDRRKTVCGTPNYIAPEVLYGKSEGHSYEVDIWSIGVILYTMLVGKPPFQMKDVKMIYQKIKDMDYAFPPDCRVSEEAKSLVKSILNKDPSQRPSLDDIFAHPWFISGAFPTDLPASSLKEVPIFPPMSFEQITHNFRKLKQRCAVGQDLPLAKTVPKQPPRSVPGVVASPVQARQAVNQAIARQEEEFKRAVAPDSPISTLLSSAKKPPVVAPTVAHAGGRADPSLMRHFQGPSASTGSPLRRETRSRGPSGSSAGGRNRDIIEEEDVDMDDDGKDDGLMLQSRLKAKRTTTATSPLREQNRRALSPARGHQINGLPASATAGSQEGAKSVASSSSGTVTNSQKYRSRALYDRITRNIDEALMTREQDLPITASEMAQERPADPKIFISSWLDYAHKYGMGHIDHIKPPPSNSSGQALRTNYSMSKVPDDEHFQERLYLLSHFEQYMMNKLNGMTEYNYQDTQLRTGMVFLTRYWRMKHVIAFRLSNDTFQFNYQDHTKLLLSHDGTVVTYIDDKYKMWTWHLSQMMKPELLAHGRERRRMDKAISKLEYAKNVIAKLDKAPRSKPTDGVRS